MPWYSFRFPIHDIGCRPGGAKKNRVLKSQIQKRKGSARRSGSLISRHFHTKQDGQCYTLPLKRSQSMAAFSVSCSVDGRKRKEMNRCSNDCLQGRAAEEYESRYRANYHARIAGGKRGPGRNCFTWYLFAQRASQKLPMAAVLRRR